VQQPIPPDEAVSSDGRGHELLELTWRFFEQASAHVHAELAAFLAGEGWHYHAGPGAYLDAVQFTAHAGRPSTRRSPTGGRLDPGTVTNQR
jgi:hypothetical protein